jgi:hypothetical protein
MEETGTAIWSAAWWSRSVRRVLVIDGKCMIGEER